MEVFVNDDTNKINYVISKRKDMIYAGLFKVYCYHKASVSDILLFSDTIEMCPVYRNS